MFYAMLSDFYHFLIALEQKQSIPFKLVSTTAVIIINIEDTFQSLKIVFNFGTN